MAKVGRKLGNKAPQTRWDIRDSYSPDNGCQVSSRCFDCPLTTDKGKYLCLKDIYNGTRSLLSNHTVIMDVYRHLDSGLTKRVVADITGLPHADINHWNYRRKHIEKVFRVYAKAIPYFDNYQNTPQLVTV